jgi:hypothetical protein
MMPMIEGPQGWIQDKVCRELHSGSMPIGYKDPWEAFLFGNGKCTDWSELNSRQSAGLVTRDRGDSHDEGINMFHCSASQITHDLHIRLTNDLGFAHSRSCYNSGGMRVAIRSTR